MRNFFLRFAFVSIVLAVPGQAGAQAFPRQRLEAVIRDYVATNGPWKAENIEVRLGPFQPVSLPSNDASYHVLRPSRGITPGPHNFLLAVEVHGKEAARMWIKAEIKVFDEVLVAAYPLAHHEVITGEKVRLERRDISGIPARPFYRVAEVEGLEATRPVEVNEILTQKSADRPVAVRRGSAIVLVYESGSLRVEAPGVAEEAGRTGDLVQVKNASSGKLLRGLVLDGRTVKVN